MGNQAAAPTQTANVDQCSCCIHFQALGCAASAYFCTRKDVFIVHDPALEDVCPHCESVEGSD